MKCKIKHGVLIVEAESTSETEELQTWRASWHEEPKKDLWFECHYYNPIMTVVI